MIRRSRLRVTHLSGGRRVGGSDWSKRLRSAGFVPWSLSLAFVWSRILAPQACEIWRRRRACQAESTPRSFLHAYLRARSSGDVHASYRIRDVDALGEFFLQITRSAGTIYRHYMPRQLNLRRVAHMIQMQREEGWGCRILLLLPPARPTARQRASVPTA